MKSNRKHWNKIFRETVDEKLGWHEDDPTQTLRLLKQVLGWEGATIFIPGAGTSGLIDLLCKAGSELILNDISQPALDKLKRRLGDRADAVEWICQDISLPLENTVPLVDLWIDRAVLHFLTDEADIQGYFQNVHSKLKMGGHALFAEFPPHGVPKCAGLELHRYSVAELSQRLGASVTLVEHFDHTYVSPSGDARPYLYALFKREA